LGGLVGSSATVCLLTGAEDWSAAWSRAAGVAVATLRTNDELGFAAWDSGDGAGVPDRVRGQLLGKRVITGSVFAAAVLEAAGVEVERLPAPAAPIAFSVCVQRGPAAAHQLACCGRRGRFDVEQPEMAADVARENVRLLDGAGASCADEGCAAWLQAHGARSLGPLHPYLEA
jgi:hypothetical protein